MSQRFRSNVERGEYRIRVFTSWLTATYRPGSVHTWTLTLPGQNRSRLVANISARWNNLNSNFLSIHKSIYGWARFLELHANGVPHLHVIVITRGILTKVQLVQFTSGLRRAALNHGFGPRMSLVPIHFTPLRVARYHNKQAISAKRIGSRPENLVSKRFFSASRAIRDDFRASNQTWVSRSSRKRKVASGGVTVAGNWHYASPLGWLLTVKKPANMCHACVLRHPRA